jgi:hypothetical protein
MGHERLLDALICSGLSDLYVTVELWSEGRRLSVSQRTRHKTFAKSYTCGRTASPLGHDRSKLA